MTVLGTIASVAFVAAIGAFGVFNFGMVAFGILKGAN